MNNSRNHNMLFWMKAGEPITVYVFGVNCQNNDDLARVVSREKVIEESKYIDI